MSIIRVNKDKNYTVMSNYHFKEKEMSLKAKGLLSQMLSLPDNWDYSIAGLSAINKESIGVIRNTLDELKSFGYLVVTKKMPNETKSGRIEYVYDVFEKPQRQEKQHQQKQGVEKQHLENQYIELQYIENDMQLNTNKQNTKKSSTNILNKYNKEFDELWKLYPRKQGKAKALQAYIKARKNGVDFDTIKKGVENYSRYIENNRIEQEYIKHGSTWFNQECWNDEYGGVKYAQGENYQFAGGSGKSTWGCSGEVGYDIEELMKIK